jgi:hypothetical protein
MYYTHGHLYQLLFYLNAIRARHILEKRVGVLTKVENNGNTRGTRVLDKFRPL